MVKSVRDSLQIIQNILDNDRLNNLVAVRDRLQQAVKDLDAWFEFYEKRHRSMQERLFNAKVDRVDHYVAAVYQAEIMNGRGFDIEKPQPQSDRQVYNEMVIGKVRALMEIADSIDQDKPS